MAKTLVIVESPTKARTLERFLGDRYTVKSSFGHVRDLPDSASQVPDEIKKKKWGRIGVDTEGDFKPYYVVPDDKKKNVAELTHGAQGRLGSDARDRPRSRRRVDQLASARSAEAQGPGQAHRLSRDHQEGGRAGDRRSARLDDNLVRAQESRRILDRLYGYTLSPVLWKKVQTGLSAGRVQSVAVRLIVDREEERLAFRAAKYSDLNAQFTADGRTFPGTLTRLGDERVASGKDFDQQGVLTVEERPAAVRGRCVAARRDPQSQPAVVGDQRRSEARRRASGRAVHHLDADAGSQPQARVLDAADDAVGAAAVPGRPHLVSPHRLDDAQRRSARGIGQRDPRDVRRRLLLRPAPLPTKVKNAQEAHEAIRPTDLHQRRGLALEGVLERRRPQDLRADLEADDGVADGRRARAADDRRDLGARQRRQAGGVLGVGQGDRVRRLPPRLCRRQRRSVGGARRAGDGAAGADGRRAGRSRQGARAPGRPRGGRARNQPAGALHRSVADQGARADRRRPAVDVRGDDRHHRAPRLRLPPGQGAGAELHGLRGDAAADAGTSAISSTSSSRRRWKRTSTRSRAASASGSTSSSSSTAATSIIAASKTRSSRRRRTRSIR